MGVGKLKSQLKLEATARLEEAARTPTDFQTVIGMWDKLEKSKKCSERNHVIWYTHVECDYIEAQNGDFLDIIFDSPADMHQLVEDADVCVLVKGLTAKQKAISAFGGIAPTYHIVFAEKPTIVWDFHSLLLGIQMMFSFALTDKTQPLRMCRHCNKVFVTSHPNAAFCNYECENRYNVYKSRNKKSEQA